MNEKLETAACCVHQAWVSVCSSTNLSPPLLSPSPPHPPSRIKSSSTTPYATPLTCGDSVEFTVYDFLSGIARRKEHRPYPEPEVAMIFKKSDSDTAVDLVEVEMTLRKAYVEVRTGAKGEPLTLLINWHMHKDSTTKGKYIHVHVAHNVVGSGLVRDIFGSTKLCATVCDGPLDPRTPMTSEFIAAPEGLHRRYHLN